MNGKHGILALLAVVSLITVSGVTTPTITSQPAAAPQAEALAMPCLDVSQSETCDVSSDLAAGMGGAEDVKPGCCSTQCNVDKDCDRICGKGVCACLQQTDCCRRCVY